MNNQSDFMNYMRMIDDHFNISLKKLEIRNKKQNIFFREAILYKAKLNIILTYYKETCSINNNNKSI
jgi:hypothetical protein